MSLTSHYTGADGLMGILSDQKLWGTDSRFLNDSDEISLSKSTFEEVTTSIDKYIIESNIDKGSDEAVFDACEKLVILLIKTAYNNAMYYVTSFSNKSDDTGQWMSYGDMGKGYCINFDLTQLKDRKNLKMGHIEYVTKNDLEKKARALSKKIAYSYSTKVLKLIREANCSKSKKSDSERKALLDKSKDYKLLQDIILEKHLIDLFMYQCFQKNKEYIQENEYRIMIAKNKNEMEDVRFRKKGNILIPYLEFNFPKEMIKSITIGPSLDPRLAIPSLEALKKKYHYSFEIKQSKSTLVHF